MIYNRLDIIPLKIFLEVYNTGNLTLLTDDKNQLLNLKNTWDKLKKDYSELNSEGKSDKILNLVARIQALRIRFEGINFVVKAVRFDPDDVDLMAELNKIGYKITRETYLSDLERIERESKSLNVKIRRLQQKLPKIEKQDENSKTTIDKVILGYCTITGLNFDTNKITVVQFYSLKELAEEKIKHMENLNSKK